MNTDALTTVAVLLIVLWLLGMVSGVTLSGFVWVFLIVAVVLFGVRAVLWMSR